MVEPSTPREQVKETLTKVRSDAAAKLDGTFKPKPAPKKPAPKLDKPVVKPKPKPAPKPPKPKKVEPAKPEKVVEPEKPTIEQKNGEETAKGVNGESAGLVKYDGEFEGIGAQFTTQKDFGGLEKGQTFTIKGEPSVSKVKEAIIQKAQQYGVKAGEFLSDKPTPEKTDVALEGEGVSLGDKSLPKESIGKAWINN